MSTVLAPVEIERRRWTASEYEWMIRIGLIAEGERIELIEGEIFQMAPQELPHENGIARAEREARRAFPPPKRVKVQLPLRFGDLSRPEPDVAVVAEPLPDDDEPHPQTVLLVVEVASSTLTYDLTTKASLYAKNAVPDYWVVNLVDVQLEIHRDPIEQPSMPFGFGYRSRTIYVPGDTVAPLHAPTSSIQVSDLFPRQAK